MKSMLMNEGKNAFGEQFNERLDELSQALTCDPTLSPDFLLDTFTALFMDIKSLKNSSEHVKKYTEKYEPYWNKVQQMRVNVHDFDVVKVLATGAVGKVCLVKGKNDEKVYAMKILKKIDLLSRREAAFFMEERNALIHSSLSEWITKLYAAFQDEEHLYLVMEFAAGGSLRSLLGSRETLFLEEEARFYIAEIAISLDHLHSFGYVHRDIKPENCLIDDKGHIKLADLGSCIRMNADHLVDDKETVGTPDYISPEILRALEESGSSYGVSSDFWSLGIILYELLCDEVPFYSESLIETYGKIMSHEKHFGFPEGFEGSPEVIDLMKRLICKKETRISSVKELKAHPWFSTINWEDIRSQTPPFIPDLIGPDDTRYFDEDDTESKQFLLKPAQKHREYVGQNLPFVGYSYILDKESIISWSRTATSNEATALSSKMDSFSTIVGSEDSAIDQERDTRIANLQAENDKLKNTSSKTHQLQEQIEDLNLKLGASSVEYQELHNQHAKSLAELNRLGSEMAHLKSKSESESGFLTRLQQSKEMLESQLAQFKDQLFEKEQALGDMKAYAGKLHADLESDSHRQIELKIVISEHENLIRSQEIEIDQLKERVRVDSVKIDTSAAKLALLEKSCSDLSESLSNVTAELALTKTQLNKAKEVTMTKADEAERNQLLQSVEDASRLKLQIESLESRNLQLQGVIKESRFKQTITEKELDELRSSFSQESSALEESKKVVQNLLEHMLSKDQIIISMENQLQKLQSQMMSHESRAGDLRRSLSAELKASKTYERQISDLEEKLKFAAIEIASIQSKYQQELNEKLKLEERLNDLTLTNLNESRSRESSQVKVAGLEELYRKEHITSEKLVAEVQAKDSKLSQILANLKSESRLRGEAERKALQLTNEMKRLDVETRSRTVELKSKIDDLEAQNHVLNEVLEREREHHHNLSIVTRMSMDSKTIDEKASLSSDQVSVISSGTISKNKFKKIFSSSLLSPRRLQKGGESAIDTIFSPLEKSPVSKFYKGPYFTSIDEASIEQLPTLIGAETPKVQSLCGWLKLPKQGKVKKGWVLKYVEVKDFQILIFNSEADSRCGSTYLSIDIRCDIFSARHVNQNELIHATSKEIDCIFQIQAANSDELKTLVKDAELDSKELERKAKVMEADINVEMKMLAALEKILLVSPVERRPQVSQQMEDCRKRINSLMVEKEKLSHGTHADDDDFGCEDVDFYRKELEDQMAQELKNMAACDKLISAMLDGHHKKRAKEIQVEKSIAESNLQHIKSDIDSLYLNDKTKIISIIERLKKASRSESNGHWLKPRKFYQPTVCGRCHEPLYENHGYQCSDCKLVCHQECQAYIEYDCSEIKHQSNIKPLYFMAADSNDRKRWLDGLLHFRSQHQKGSINRVSMMSIPRTPVKHSLHPK